jgi:hypothetical protein
VSQLIQKTLQIEQNSFVKIKKGRRVCEFKIICNFFYIKIQFSKPKINSALTSARFLNKETSDLGAI